MKKNNKKIKLDLIQNMFTLKRKNNKIEIYVNNKLLQVTEEIEKALGTLAQSKFMFSNMSSSSICIGGTQTNIRGKSILRDGSEIVAIKNGIQYRKYDSNGEVVFEKIITI